VKESTPKNARSYDDSSDEEDEQVDEIVTGFDQFGVQRCVSVSTAQQCRPGPQLTKATCSGQYRLHEKKKEGPLVIPALANRDWREVARKRKAGDIFVPEGARAKTGADGSVGGLGTRDAINSGPEVVGLIKAEKRMKMDVDDDQSSNDGATDDVPVKEETEDEKAMRALLARANGEDAGEGGISIDVIPLTDNQSSRVLSETDAYKQDVVTRPDPATLEDYERVPVSEFGAALLRGMGWKPGQAASRTRKGPVDPYLPTARPALLGIGAKEKEVFDDGNAKNGKAKGPPRPDKRYIPVVKRERERGSASAPASRRTSRSPSPERRWDGERDRDRDRDRDRTREKERDRDRDRDRDKDRDRDYDRRREKDRDYASDYDKGRRDRKREMHRDYDSDRERTRDRRGDDRDYDRRDRGSDRERDKDRRR
jgi:hypothetical protein